jgi:hypothetical protein
MCKGVFKPILRMGQWFLGSFQSYLNLAITKLSGGTTA